MLVVPTLTQMCFYSKSVPLILIITDKTVVLLLKSFVQNVYCVDFGFWEHLPGTVGLNSVHCKHKAEHLKINTGWCRPMSNPLLSAQADSQENYRSSHTAVQNSTPDTQTEASRSGPDNPCRKFTFPADVRCAFRLGELTELTFSGFQCLSARVYQTFRSNGRRISGWTLTVFLPLSFSNDVSFRTRDCGSNRVQPQGPLNFTVFSSWEIWRSELRPPRARLRSRRGIYPSQQANAQQRQHLRWDNLLSGQTMCIPIFITHLMSPWVALFETTAK